MSKQNGGSVYRSALRSDIEQLSFREQLILNWSYGYRFVHVLKMTDEAMGELLEISTNRVGQIRDRSLTKLAQLGDGGEL